ncbi:hypothetical protein DL89DRAFT_165974 [Linderina pennispora]|uniref:Kinetochore protein Spc24 n=1 Tax=Linderina pennispora TaxID=61395 RepID=A0A1Y1W967_9FUNG|nr:uncharacterized protein DL89DRAFT_165974 [Linderina pennispora]ORX69796.1 hypothetical protein DL89DRAFT_165974 [Linderina pennispora]
MDIEDLSQQREQMQQTIDSLKQSNDALVAKEVAHHVDNAQTIRKSEVDTLQESLQALSRRLQTARGKVDASKAQREEKSHAETMRELRAEKQSAEQGISDLNDREQRLQQEITALEERMANMSDNIEQELDPGAIVMQLQVLRSLGVEPLVNGQSKQIDKARIISPSSVTVVQLDKGCAETPDGSTAVGAMLITIEITSIQKYYIRTY